MKTIAIKMVTGKCIRTVLVFIAIFSVLFSSLFLKGMASCFEEYITGKMDIYTYLQPGILNTYADKEKFLTLNSLLPENSYDGADVEQTELYVFKCFSGDSFASIIYDYSLLAKYKGEELNAFLDEKFDLLCYGFIHENGFTYMDGNAVELHRNSDFVERYPFLTLSTGRVFTEKELLNGERVCLIGEDYAQIIKTENGYSIKKFETGDTVYLTKVVLNNDYSIKDVFTFSLTVIGTVKKTGGMANDYADNVFLPEETMELILREHGHNDIYENRSATYPNYDIGMIGVYKISSFSQLEKLKKQIDKYKSDNWIYYTSLDKYGYSGMADLVLSISKSFRIVSYALVVLILIVSAALIVLDINSRRNEIGLLKSMGKEDREIIRDNSIVHILVYLISAAIGYLVSVKLSRAVMEYQFSNGGTDGTKLLNIADKLLKLNNSGIILAVMFIIILCIESVILYRYLISRVTVKELLEKQE